MTPQERFWAKVDTSAGPDGCWLWTGYCLPSGYGLAPKGRQKSTTAHRRSYELNVGAIPEGHVVCHRCDNPPCVNPAHLFSGTQGVNLLDMVTKGRDRWAGRTHCTNGHEITPENTQYGTRHGRPRRRCRDCRRDSYVRSRA